MQHKISKDNKTLIPIIIEYNGYFIQTFDKGTSTMPFQQSYICTDRECTNVIGACSSGFDKINYLQKAKNKIDAKCL